MSVDIWLYYLLAVLVLTASPGPSSLLCMTRGVTSGWTSGAYTALGSLTAITGILTLSFTGLGLVVASSDLLFTLVKWSGAVYLVYLGIKSLLSRQESYAQAELRGPGERRFKAHFASGFIVGASNPKAILFFTALFPQFIDPAANLWLQYLVFAGTFVVFELSWLLFYAYLGSRSSGWIFASGRARLFNRLTGGVFIGAGALLSTSSRI
ncbi:LysE family translocator [Marinobacterium sediminicola]|uniref:Threonine/homoserine/homoserine lactone efflux protein n=1 Tax=Marinobacterium sediminicola TaxID=518898 RepID=A0ABY1S4A2_9GAMM|nr:LysE family translocator [Marinobacterium sediminicola]ULG68962.1 LysE family translocator [Marinobacterium sediminicola]SMR78464.1 Threonine/homoserine/homoserine lactone efflux protein [Marinobacterium sediminicola]